MNVVLRPSGPHHHSRCDYRTLAGSESSVSARNGLRGVLLVVLSLRSWQSGYTAGYLPRLSPKPFALVTLISFSKISDSLIKYFSYTSNCQIHSIGLDSL